LVGREDQTRQVLATNRLEQAWSQHCEAFHLQTAALYSFFENIKNVTVHLMMGVLTAPGGGELSTAAQPPALLGELLLILLV